METSDKRLDDLPEYSTIIKLLADSKAKLEYAKKCNKEKRELAEREIELEKEIADISSANRTLKFLVKQIDTYLNQKKLKAETFIQDAINISKSIIPSTEEYRVILNDKELKIVSREGQEIEEADGQGFASILAAMILIQIILFTQSRPTLVLDEKFAAVRADKTALLADLLEAYKDKVQFIIIEQKPEIEAFAETVHEVYKEKNNSFVKKGENNNVI